MNEKKEIVVKSIGLTKIFRDFWGRPKAKAVNDLDFEVAEGEIFGLLGPNGSGKSTTIKMLLGLLYPTSGVISVYDRPPEDVKTKQRIGYLPEDSYLYKYLTAAETLDFFGALFNLSAAERRSRTAQLLDMVGLSHASKRQVGEFSKGMARRIGLAQAMINDPDLLVLDEPTSGLDPLGCREIKDLILFLKKRGKTVIVSSHLLADVEDVCDRVVILYGGKIRASGNLDQLLTVSNENRVKIPYLGPQETEKLLKLLRENLKGEQFSLEHPRRSLEDFFLEVVQKAKEERLETFGAHGGGNIAEYLTDHNDKPILEKLAVSDKIQQEKSEIIPEPSDKAPEEQKASAGEEVLSTLLVGTGKQKDSTTSKSGAEEKFTDADEKLSKLLGEDKKS
ncbi:MAG TPA: ABC transporter ATP-binding protein [Victivallales bacterium]|nr:ABC transporter ATP-binding protein [Victivallales bacterium]